MTSRIKGPSAPSGGPPPVDETSAVDATEGVREPDAADAPSGVSGPEAARATDAPDAVAQVAAQLRAGEIGVDQAVELLIEDAIQRQVGRAVDGRTELAPQLRELLRGYATSDPFLLAKIRRLTLVK
jgi:hypothetical protein